MSKYHVNSRYLHPFSFAEAPLCFKSFFDLRFHLSIQHLLSLPGGATLLLSPAAQQKGSHWNLLLLLNKPRYTTQSIMFTALSCTRICSMVYCLMDYCTQHDDL
ncbi:hypothetical protein V6Z12_A12G285500 [Gossypium hirsutum]